MYAYNSNTQRSDQLKKYIKKTIIVRDYLLHIVDQLNISIKRSQVQLDNELKKNNKHENFSVKF